MARKPGSKASGEFALFDVFYEDGTQRSNRKVPRTALTSLEGNEAARAIIEEQDGAIGEKSGNAPIPIKSIRRSGEK
jgi:hypothetical protein